VDQYLENIRQFAKSARHNFFFVTVVEMKLEQVDALLAMQQIPNWKFQ